MSRLLTARSFRHLVFKFSRARLFIFAWLLPTFALAAPVRFDVPSQPASAALLAFSQQSGTEVLFSFDDLRQVQSTAVAGTLEPDAALSRLLKDTGFFARRTSQGKFVVTRSASPTGSIKGRLLLPDGAPASGISIVIADATPRAVSDENGEFTLVAVESGTHRLHVSGEGVRPLEIIDVRVDPQRTSNVETHTLQTSDELVRLAPQIVEGRFFRRWKDRGDADFQPQRAAGNLDLPRTGDDALPYNIYDRDEIARSGVVTLNEFLQRNILDSAAGTLPPEQQAGIEKGGGPHTPILIASSTNLTMRGYNADETAILVNGRRLPEVLTSGGLYAALPPDVNFIPLSLVERIEVLPVSASALYSGNPVGGVINIVLRPDVNATEVTTTYTNALGGFDAPQSSLSLQHGQTLLDGKLRVRVNATFTRTDPAAESELGYIQARVRETAVPPSPLFRATPNIRSASGSPLFAASSAIVTSVAPDADGTGGLSAFNDRQGVLNTNLFETPGGTANSPESLDYAYGRRQRGSTYFGSVTYDLTPWLQFAADGIYSRSTMNRGYNVFAADLALAADSPLNPFGQAVQVSLNETLPLLGERYSEGRVDFYSVVAGALLKLPADWRVSLDAQYGRSVTHYRGVAGVDSDRWQQLVDDGRYNPLRDTQLHGPPAAFYDEVLIFYGQRDRFVTLGDYETIDTALRVTNQSIPLPTGSGAVNFGGDYRINRLAGYTDERRYGDGGYARAPTRWSGRTVERVSVFGELQAPLLPTAWLPSWIREIDADVAARYVAAATAQETNIAPTAGLKIDFAGGFALRSSIATSNRFPPPFMSRQVAAPSGPGGGDVELVTIRDPRRQNEQYGVLASTALNPNLRTEANVTRAVGLVYQRGTVHRLRLSTDFSDTRKSSEQSTLDANAVINLESAFPNRVIRAPAGPNEEVGRITSVLTGPVNLAWRHSQNLSSALDYAWTECLGGRLDLYGRWSYFSRYEVQVLPGDPTVDELGNPDGTVPGLLRHRMNFGAAWSNRNHGFGLDGHYYHSRRLPKGEWSTQHRRTIDPYWQFDAYVQTDLARWLPWKSSRFGLRGQLRVNNVFNARPPRYANDSSSAGVQSYGDWRGQTYALTLQATF